MNEGRDWSEEENGNGIVGTCIDDGVRPEHIEEYGCESQVVNVAVGRIGLWSSCVANATTTPAGGGEFAVTELGTICRSLNEAFTHMTVFDLTPSDEIPTTKDFPDTGLMWAQAGSVLALAFGVGASVVFALGLYNSNRAVCLERSPGLFLLARDLGRPIQLASLLAALAAAWAFVAIDSFLSSPYIGFIGGDVLTHLVGVQLVSYAPAFPAMSAMRAAGIAYALAAFLTLLVPGDVGSILAEVRNAASVSSGDYEEPFIKE